MSGFTKIITLDATFPTGEPGVQLVSTWSKTGKVIRAATSITKTAAHSPAEDYIRSVEPEPGKSIVLIIGLGDHETYGPNRNGDGFPSEPVPGKIASDETLDKHYKSYENAHVFEHHVNHDPAKAIGHVKKAFWNPYMHRVEVLQDFDHKKAPHILEKLASGDPLATSMGCRIKYDVCSSCGNKAKTRGEYCDHLKYAMSQIDPATGIQNAALNPSPDFFDSSFVMRPADRTGYVLKKVAKVSTPYELNFSSFDLGEMREDLISKSAELGKAADIEKVISGEPAASVSSLDSQDAKLVDKYYNECSDKEPMPGGDKAVTIMIKYKPGEVAGTTEDMGLPMGIREMLKYFMGKMSPGTEVPEEVVKSASAHLGTIFQVYSAYPRFFDDVVKSASLNELVVRKELQEKLSAFEPQSVTQDYFYRRLVPEAFRENERPLTDMVSVTNPQTGQQMQTNYGTVQKTNDALVHHNLMGKAMAPAMLGAGAMFGAAGLGMGLAGAQHALNAPMAGPKVRTDQGENISGWTEMTPKQASIAPEIRYIQKRAHDGKIPRLAKSVVDNILSQIKNAEIHDDLSVYLGPTLDLDKVAEIVGIAIKSHTLRP